MTINPCCIPLKTGVRMVTHLSMALALAVGWTALQLISISSEVSSNVATGTSTGVIKASDAREGSVGSNTVFIGGQQTPVPPPPPSFYNAHIFESHQVPPQYRIPYEYILYHKWHQQQQQILQQQQLQRTGLEGYHHNSDSQQQYHQQQRPYYDDIYFWHRWHQQQQQQQQQQQPFMPGHWEKHNESGSGFGQVIRPTPLLKQQDRSSSQEGRSDGSHHSSNDYDDEQSKIFRSILLQRKNFKGLEPPSESLPSGDLRPVIGTRRNFTRHGVVSQEGDERPLVTAADNPPEQKLSSSLQFLQKEKEEGTRAAEHVSIDSSPSSPSSPRMPPPPQDEKREGTGTSSQEALRTTVTTTGASSSQAPHFRPLVLTRRHQQQKNQRFQPNATEKGHEEANTTTTEMYKPQAMMLMSKLTREDPQRDGAGYYDGGVSQKSTSPKKLLANFKAQYAKTLLVCGLLALCTVVFQFLTSFLLLCFVDKGSNAAAQIWTAVHCSVIFSLATCLVLFLCEGLSMPKYIFDETLYLCLITIDSLLSIYFLWVVMAFI